MQDTWKHFIFSISLRYWFISVFSFVFLDSCDRQHQELMIGFISKSYLGNEGLWFFPGYSSAQVSCLTSRRHKPGMCPWVLEKKRRFRNIELDDWLNWFSLRWSNSSPDVSRQNYHWQGAIWESSEELSQSPVQLSHHEIHFLILSRIQIRFFLFYCICSGDAKCLKNQITKLPKNMATKVYTHSITHKVFTINIQEKLCRRCI